MANEQEVPELRELLNLLEEIAVISTAGRGNDDASNVALRSIDGIAARAIVVVRSLDETTRFNVREIIDQIRKSIRA